MGVKSSLLEEETSHRDWEMQDLIEASLLLFTTCSGCDYTKADSCVIKYAEMISLNRLWAPGFFPNGFQW